MFHRPSQKTLCQQFHISLSVRSKEDFLVYDICKFILVMAFTRHSHPRVLPGVFGYLALVLGVAVEAMGLVGFFNASANNGGVGGTMINIVLIAQELWIVVAAITFVVRAGKVADSTSVQEQESVVGSHR
jgi:hypothetical protein